MFWRKCSKEESGQALTEMALVLPLLLLLVFGVTEMGRVGYAYITVNNAARAGARVASVGGDDAAIRDAVLQAAPALDPTLLDIEISPSFAQRQSGQNATISVNYPVQLIIPVVQGFPNPVLVGASLSMRLE
ncbi:MAG: pilus assembly protein [Desulfitobacteriaceae bacterium]|nr:pilus assembly protein [Desulfitobacteriaceae bacterium]MDI6879373.1 pilus assembly protein [Desulfitobacteriaceae bacterium]MDI6913996.1 pilus assembly protein [Desulfitobacteriaceae bacterium]